EQADHVGACEDLVEYGIPVILEERSRGGEFAHFQGDVAAVVELRVIGRRARPQLRGVVESEAAPQKNGGAACEPYVEALRRPVGYPVVDPVLIEIDVRIADDLRQRSLLSGLQLVAYGPSA